ncbi:MAG: sulfatase-like hydrolase/transferase [Planctomycetota bacterium]|nr:sulfatase-like hydrolase/transferase [Planctomycetota bacterium]
MLLAGASAAHAQERPPNIVILFCDDLGYGDVMAYADGYDTPHLDALARQGIKLTSFYVAQPVCSASRAALLTGCYPNRIGIQGALGPNTNHGLPGKYNSIDRPLELYHLETDISETTNPPKPNPKSSHNSCASSKPPAPTWETNSPTAPAQAATNPDAGTRRRQALSLAMPSKSRSCVCPIRLGFPCRFSALR